MSGQGNDGWRRRGGARCLSMTEVSLTLSVILGLAFVSVRVMKMEGPLPWHQAPVGELAATAPDGAPADTLRPDATP